MFIPLSFAPPPPAITTKIYGLAAADFNTDGKLDLVLGAFQTGGPPAIQRIHVMLGNGNGTFQGPTAWGPLTVSSTTSAWRTSTVTRTST